MNLKAELKNKLAALADQFETEAFLEKDPSKFMHRYPEVRDAEAVAFLAANMAFGRREQILSHVEEILDAAGEAPSEWILASKYEAFFKGGSSSFYRMYSHDDFRLFFATLKAFLEASETIGDFVRAHYDGGFLHETICKLFPESCKLVPHSKASAAKKVNMLLRWMVRGNSPVDLGLWPWYPKEKLLMPLDTHVMQEATRLGILEPSASGKPKSATLKTAIELTNAMKEVFPNDPTRADYALFGLGVSE